MEINGYKLDEVDPRTGRPRLLARLLRTEGRRHDGVRLLDLQRRLPRAGPQPGRASAGSPTTRCSRTGASPGRTTAASCTTAPRPIPTAGRGRSGRSSIWWDEEKRRWVGLDRAGLRAGQAARLSAAARREGHGGHRRRPAVHHEARRRRLALRPGAVKDGPLPTHYEPVESPVGNLLYPQAGVQPDGASVRGAAQPPGAHADGRVSRWWPPRSGSPSTT